jgi:hypothetical protein
MNDGFRNWSLIALIIKAYHNMSTDNNEKEKIIGIKQKKIIIQSKIISTRLVRDQRSYATRELVGVDKKNTIE